MIFIPILMPNTRLQVHSLQTEKKLLFEKNGKRFYNLIPLLTRYKSLYSELLLS